jgi:hypothetical protein
MGGPTSSIRYYQHSSRDRMTTQAPPLHQIRDTFGGIFLTYFGKKTQRTNFMEIRPVTVRSFHAEKTETERERET